MKVLLQFPKKDNRSFKFYSANPGERHLKNLHKVVFSEKGDDFRSKCGPVTLVNSGLQEFFNNVVKCGKKWEKLLYISAVKNSVP
jgi:hypothetical protein